MYQKTIVPQLSKCLKFETVRGEGGGLNGSKDFYLNKQTNKTHACVVVHRMAHHNHLIDLNNLLSSFVKLMVIKSHLSTFIRVFANIPTEK